MSVSIVVAAIAAYAAIVSTLSLVLAMKVYRAGNPNVEMDWLYRESDRKLLLSILNTGRADVTISTVELFIVHETITSRSRSGRFFNVRTDTLGHVPSDLWRVESEEIALPIRLASNSLVSMQVKTDVIHLPSGYPLDEIVLKFVARFPNGKGVSYLRGDVLRHFMGIDPDRPISFPSPASLPRED
jgi:hypothetical protein